MKKPCLALLCWGILFCLLGPSAVGREKDLFAHLPPGWKVLRSFEVSTRQREAIGKKLGGKLAVLSNTLLAAGEERIQVNLMEGATEKDAVVVLERLRAVKGNPELCLRNGKQVVEFVCKDLRLARRAAYVIGLKPQSAAYRVSFDTAPVEGGDYLALNPLFNAFLDLARHPGDATVKGKIASLEKKLAFGRTLRLRAAPSGGAPPSYRFTPAPASRARASGAAVESFTFPRLPKRAGVPCIHVEAQVEVRAFAVLPGPPPDPERCCAATPFWPADDPELTALAKEITGGTGTVKEKVQALLDWMMPGRNIRYGGGVTGSRFGVKKVLAQKAGHCWDFSDLFVTLCRAAGVPARQVAGWLFERTGHVWAEVYVQGEGWQQVDPTAGMACGSDYIPLFTTEDGEMPVLYLSMPGTTRAGSGARSPRDEPSR